MSAITGYEVGPRGESRPITDTTDPLVPAPITERAA